ncbi:MAG: family four-helix-bundle protein [Flaviaesturariibacter sp.]|nr:family four-helix-bundle protein [Flaviaesturariibacter sp.]
MANKEKVAGILNDLIEINNDRIVGYEKAIDELKDENEDLRPLFQRYIQESTQYKSELQTEVTRLGEEPTNDGTTNSGKIYRVWMDLKAVVTGKDRKTVLENCEFGEDAAQKAYDMALNTDEELEPTVRDLLVRQKTQLRVGHDEVKRLRDLERAAH